MPIPETYTHPYRANWIKKRDKKQGCELCSTCVNVNHFFTRYYLVLGQNKDRISEKNWETFRSNIEVAFFKKKVDDFRTSQKSFEDWWCTDKSSSQNKIMSRISALLR